MCLSKYIGIIAVIAVCCINHKTISYTKDLVKIDTLEVHKKLEIMTEPSIDHPTIEVKSSQYGLRKKYHNEIISYRHQPTLLGWASVAIPSALFAGFGYYKYSNGSVVLGRDMMATSILPPLFAFGFSMLRFKKQKTTAQTFKFESPNTSDLVNIQISNIGYTATSYPTNNGVVALNLENYVRKLPSRSDINFSFSLPDKSIKPCEIVVGKNLFERLNEVLKREKEAEELLMKADEYYSRGQFSKAYSLYKEISEKYYDTNTAYGIGEKLSDTKKKMELAKKQEEFNKMKYKTLNFLKKYGFTNYSIEILIGTLNKLKDEVRILIITEGLKLPAKDAINAWSAYNNLSIFQKLYGLLVTVELAVGNEPFYKKQLLEDWVYWSDIAERLSYINSSQLLKEP